MSQKLGDAALSKSEEFRDIGRRLALWWKVLSDWLREECISNVDIVPNRRRTFSDSQCGRQDNGLFFLSSTLLLLETNSHSPSFLMLLCHVCLPLLWIRLPAMPAFYVSCLFTPSAEVMVANMVLTMTLTAAPLRPTNAFDEI